jgi:hypothetical protein
LSRWSSDYGSLGRCRHRWFCCAQTEKICYHIGIVSKVVQLPQIVYFFQSRTERASVCIVVLIGHRMAPESNYEYCQS